MVVEVGVAVAVVVVVVVVVVGGGGLLDSEVSYLGSMQIPSSSERRVEERVLEGGRLRYVGRG